MMTMYYKKLTDIFWVSENYLFHAAAWYKLYTLSRAHGKSSNDDEMKLYVIRDMALVLLLLIVCRMASSVLLAALCVPLQVEHNDVFNEFDDDKERGARLATLLGYQTAPRRDTLLNDVVCFHPATCRMTVVGGCWSPACCFARTI